MTRVLDIDLDFFVHDVEYYASRDSDRLDAAYFPPWSMSDVPRPERPAARADFEGRGIEECGLSGVPRLAQA